LWTTKFSIFHFWFLHFILHMFDMFKICVKITIESWWRNNESILELLCILNEWWNPYHRFLLLRITQNIKYKEIVIVTRKKCVNTIYIGIKMSKTTYYMCCKYYWKYNLYCFISKKRTILSKIYIHQSLLLSLKSSMLNPEPWILIVALLCHCIIQLKPKMTVYIPTLNLKGRYISQP
jgi:hypothetical protein